MDLAAAFGLTPFTQNQAQELGFTYREWRRLQAGLTRVRRGVYVTRWGPTDRIRHSQRAAAELLTRTDHFMLAASAICALGLPNPYFRSWDRVPVAIGGRQTRSARGVQLSRAVPTLTAWGPSTDLIDTAEAVAAELPLPQALMVTDAVARRLAGTQDRLVLASERCRTEVRRRLTTHHDHPALRLANPAAESPAESFCRGHMLLRGYRDPACGVPLRGASGAQYYADIMVGPFTIEVDGREKYRDLRVLIDEKTREDDLRAAGFGFHRCFVEDLYADPEREMRSLDDRVGHHGRLAWPA